MSISWEGKVDHGCCTIEYTRYRYKVINNNTGRDIVSGLMDPIYSDFDIKRFIQTQKDFIDDHFIPPHLRKN